MESEGLTLELLMKRGYPDIETFLEGKELDEDRKQGIVTETEIYGLMNNVKMYDNYGSYDDINRFLSQEKFVDYFNSTKNTELLERYIDLVDNGIDGGHGPETSRWAINFLKLEHVNQAIRNNLKPLKEKMTKLLDSAYDLTFSHYENDSGDVNKYSQILNQWNDVINARGTVKQIINGWNGLWEFYEHNNDPDFLNTALPKLIEMTDRDYVSELMGKFSIGDNEEEYNALVESGIVDRRDLKKMDHTMNYFITLVEGFESSDSSSVNLVNALEKGTKDEIETKKKYLGSRIGDLFRAGEIYKIDSIVRFGFNDCLCDEETAKNSLTPAIAEAITVGDVDQLESLFKLPDFLIDQEAEEIKPFVDAYQLLKDKEE